jgi:hypothetical protein
MSEELNHGCVKSDIIIETEFELVCCQEITEELNHRTFVSSNKFDEISAEKQETEFKYVCYEERELFDTNVSHL